MALKPVTLRLDEEEYERLREHLSKFGDPDINVAYVLRAYIRDLNRVMPFLVSSGWDLKNYFGLLGYWLKQASSITDLDMLAKSMINPWSLWKPVDSNKETDSDQATSSAGDEPLDLDEQPKTQTAKT